MNRCFVVGRDVGRRFGQLEEKGIVLVRHLETAERRRRAPFAFSSPSLAVPDRGVNPVQAVRSGYPKMPNRSLALPKRCEQAVQWKTTSGSAPLPPSTQWPTPKSSSKVSSECSRVRPNSTTAMSFEAQVGQVCFLAELRRQAANCRV